MECSDIIAIVDIALNLIVTIVFGVWIANAIMKANTKERFLKEYFTNELNDIKYDCKVFFDEICYDKKSAKDIKTGFKVLSTRLAAFESNAEQIFKEPKLSIHNILKLMQCKITDFEEYNEQYKKEVITFSTENKNSVLEQRSTLLTEFSNAVVAINGVAIKRKIKKAPK